MKNLDKMVGEILEYGSEKTGIGKELIEKVRELCVYQDIFGNLFTASLIFLLIFLVFKYLTRKKIINWHGTEEERKKLNKNALIWGIIGAVVMMTIGYLSNDLKEKLEKQPTWFTNNLAKIPGCECVKIDPEIKEFDRKINQILEEQDARNKKISNAIRKHSLIIGDLVQYSLDFSYALLLLAILLTLTLPLGSTPTLIIGYLKDYQKFKRKNTQSDD